MFEQDVTHTWTTGIIECKTKLKSSDMVIVCSKFKLEGYWKQKMEHNDRNLNSSYIIIVPSLVNELSCLKTVTHRTYSRTTKS